MAPRINLGLDVVLFVLLTYRLHREWLFENGAWLRIALCFGFAWLTLADLDMLIDMWRFPFVTTNRGPAFRWIVLAGVLIDLLKRHPVATPKIDEIIAQDEQRLSDGRPRW